MTSYDHVPTQLRLTSDQRQQLRTLTFDAVAECMGKLRHLYDSDHKFDRHNYPIRDPQASGTYAKVAWSSTSKDAPQSYRSAIGPSTSYRAVIPVSEVGGIRNLVSFVRGQEQLRNWIVPDGFGDDGWREHLLTVQVADLPLEIVERHIHSAGWEIVQEVLDQIFQELETWWLNRHLAVELLIPILGISFETSDDVQFESGVRLVRLSAKEQLARWPGQFLGDQGDFVSMATHALVISNWTMTNDQALHWFRPTDPPENIPAVERFFEALAVVTSEPTGYVQTIARPRGWSPGYVADLPVLLTGPLVSSRKSQRLKPAPEPRVTFNAMETTFLQKTYAALGSHDAIALAASRLLSAERRADEADRIVDLCVGLEALLSDSQGETTYKVALRATAMLAYQGITNPSRFFQAMKIVYAHRSAIVHGRRSSKTATVTMDGEVLPTDLVAHLVLRRLLEARIDNPELNPAEIDSKILMDALTHYSAKEENGSPH